MALESLILVRILEGLGLVAGLSIVYFALRAYGRTNHKPMISLAFAFTLLTSASVVQGVLFELFGFDLLEAQSARAAIMLAGFVAVLYSIYKTK